MGRKGVDEGEYTREDVFGRRGGLGVIYRARWACEYCVE